MKVPCKNIPTYNHDTKEWSTTSFPDQNYFGKYLLDNCFREPGEYNFNKESWNILTQLGKYWEENRYYTQLPAGTKAYNEFWDKELLRCRLGVLWIHDGVTRYMTRDYYFFLNFCPITNKEKSQEETMASFRDVQYHMMLYEKIAEAFHLHSCILKRRQMAYSNCHVAKTLNFLWFENKKTMKWFASDDAYINDINGSWKIFDAYKNHLQRYTAWDKVISGSYPEIIQQEKIKVQGRWLTDGNDSTLIAKTTGRDAKNGVGGPAYWLWHEEGGIAPKADETKQYLDSNLESGLEKVGSFCIGGSVGDLKQCKPLEKFLKDPTLYHFLAVPTKWWDESGVEKMCGLFIPAQYGMPEAVDEHGNSQIEKALELIHKAEFIGFKAGEYGRIQDEPAWINLTDKEYAIKKSQSPTTIKQAFAYRDTSRWPIKKIEKRQLFIKDNDIQPKKVELIEDDKGEITWKLSNKDDIPYPVDKKAADKSGVVLMWEEPKAGYKYYGGVDNVEVAISTTSDSLFSIYIVKGVAKIRFQEEDGTWKERMEGIKIVASWTGRLGENPEENNDYAIMLIKLYNARTLCERNKPNFMNRCISRGIAAKYLIKEKELPFNKEMDFTKQFTSDEYGIHMDGVKNKEGDNIGEGKKQSMCDDYAIGYLTEELDAIYKKDANGNYTTEKLKVFYGIDRINDYWLLEEFKYVNKENTDRENAFRLAMVAAKTYEIQGLITNVVEQKKKEIQPKKVRTINLLGTQGTGYGFKKNKKQRSINLLR